MFKKIIIAVAAVMAGFQLAADVQTVNFDMNQVTIEAKADGVEINWFCKEPNMEYVKKFYSKPRWNVFSGEAMELQFSPYASRGGARMPFPYYRLMVNPSGSKLTAFLTPDWRSAGVFPKIEGMTSEGWKAKWFIQYAALESSYYNTAKAAPLFMQNRWRLDFKYRRSAGGKSEMVSAQPFILTVPAEAVAVYRQIYLAGVKAVPGKGGEVALAAVVNNTQNAPFAGKAQWLLYSDGKMEIIKELPLNIAAKGNAAADIKYTLPERAVKFAVALQVIDNTGKVIRISRQLNVANPYVE